MSALVLAVLVVSVSPAVGRLWRSGRPGPALVVAALVAVAGCWVVGQVLGGLSAAIAALTGPA
ncbi:hypothetical protein GCM10028801_44510 [Nocardioides maradonensis]